MNLTNVDQLPYLTAAMPGIGGELKRRPEDFLVEEIPLYEPCGEGEHLYLWVEKRRRLTTDATRLLAAHFKVSDTAVGFAGLKDKHAITRQMISLQGADPALAESFDDQAIKILGADLHTNKLRRGHLKGNRFAIAVRQVEPSDAVRAKAVLDHLVQIGAPNYAGEQRFGYRRNNHMLGRYLLLEQWQEFLDEMLGNERDDGESDRNKIARRLYEQGDYTAALKAWATVHRFERQAIGPLSRGAAPIEAINGIDRTQRNLLLSAFQSHIFNQVVQQRVQSNTLGTLCTGDIAMKHENRACFAVEDPAAEQPRCDTLAISPTGPMWGAKMLLAGGEVGAMEEQMLAEAGVTQENLATGEYQADGQRRPLRMPVRNAELSGGMDDAGAYIRCKFDLPRGCFATVVMREIMKNDQAPLDNEEDDE